jgi:hypothetical protein
MFKELKQHNKNLFLRYIELVKKYIEIDIFVSFQSTKSIEFQIKVETN